MAFYNKNIAKNKTLRKAWRAGHQIKLEENEEICLPQICCEIGRYMRRDRAPCNRLSLRSFSVLLCGAIRLYRDEVDTLLSDISTMSWLKRRTPCLSVLRTIDRDLLPDCLDNSEQESFVLMPRTIQLREVTGNNCEEIDSSEESTGIESSDDEDLSSDSTVFTVLSDDKNNTLKRVETRDQAVQTSVSFGGSSYINEGFDANLPFGYVIVHDNYHSRIPSKIFFTSLNVNVKNINN